jgi:hypothetical protein
VRRRKENPGVATYGEVWKGLKSDLRKAPRGLFELIFSLDTYLLLGCFVAVPTIYYVGTALLFSYLPGRLYGAVKQSWVWDSLLGLLLGTIAVLYLWGKYVRPRRKRAEKFKRLKAIRAELARIRGGGGTGLSPSLVCLALGTMMGTVWAQELSENPYGVESTSNPYGQYGSPFGIESANNPFGRGIPLETNDVDSGLGKEADHTEAVDEPLARQRQELEMERIELKAEAERLSKEFEEKIQKNLHDQSLQK